MHDSAGIWSFTPTACAHVNIMEWMSKYKNPGFNHSTAVIFRSSRLGIKGSFLFPFLLIINAKSPSPETPQALPAALLPRPGFHAMTAQSKGGKTEITQTSS